MNGYNIWFELKAAIFEADLSSLLRFAWCVVELIFIPLASPPKWRKPA